MRNAPWKIHVLWMGLFITTALEAQVSNIGPQGTATQSSEFPCCGGFPAPLAIDGNLGNFTATGPEDMAPTWEVDLSAVADAVEIHRIVVHNRDGCCPERLRDITVSVLDAVGGSVVYESDLLNPADELAGPEFLELDFTGAPISGAVVRVTRTPDLAAAGDDIAVMSLGEVEVFADTSALPVEIGAQPASGTPGSGDCVTLSVGLLNAENAESIAYQWFFEDEELVGATGDSVTFRAGEDTAGTYYVVVTADGDVLTSDVAEITVGPVNVALGGVATQSSDYGAFVATLANDGDLGNFTATGPDDPAPTWQVDLTPVAESVPIDRIVVHNRDGCCPERLRDITVSILDASGEGVLYDSGLLNPANELAGPEFLEVDLVAATGGAVEGSIVRVTRTPDGSATGDDVAVMSLGEVEILAGGFSLPESPNLARRRCDVSATQSTTLGAFGAEVAIDGSTGNFTATLPDDPDPTWQVDLAAPYDIGRIVVHNRGDGCCQSRLRDITVLILDEPGGEVVFESELLNAENELGGGTTDGPPSLEVDLAAGGGGGVIGRVVVVRRTPDPDLSGTGGEGNADEAAILSIGEVEVLEAVVEGIGPFLMGDSNADGRVDLSDATYTLAHLFLGGSEPVCRASANANGDAIVDLSDAVYGLTFLFLGGPAPVGPYPECGLSSSENDEALGCDEPTCQAL